MERLTPSPLGALLRRARLAAGLTQEQLAEQTGVSVHTISNLERGSPHRPRTGTIQLLAEELRLPQQEYLPLLRSAARRSMGEAPPASTAALTIFSGSSRPLFGRAADLAAVRTLLSRAAVRWLTITGPAGVGKTRLAGEVAATLQREFADGVVFVSLVSVRDPHWVAQAIAQQVGVHETSEPLEETLATYLQRKRLLLLLDNFEQVAPAASLVASLLASCPTLKVLVTSRAVLHVRDEQVYTLTPLALPVLTPLPPVAVLAQAPAIALFIERAQAVIPTFKLAAENAQAIALICQRLDGLPLALELAAPWLRLLPPAALLAHLERRLPLLSEGALDLPSHQQALRDTIAWSYDLLPPGTRQVFRRLAVFWGSTPLEAIKAVCETTNEQELLLLKHLAALLDASLVYREGSADHLPRISLLETIREYGLEQLHASGEAEAAERAHAAYYLAFAEAAEPELTGPDQMNWFERVAGEYRNLQAALQWARGHEEVELGLRLVVALWRFWYTRGHLTEGRMQVESLLALAQETHPVRQTALWARALNAAGVLAARQSDNERAEQYYAAGLALCRTLGDRRALAAVLNNLGGVLRDRGEYGQATSLWEESLALRQELGEPRGIALALHNLGGLAYYQGDCEQAARLYAESLALRRQLGDSRGIASCLNSWGNAAREQGQYAHAQTLLQEALHLYRALGEPQGLASTLDNLGSVAYEQGDVAQAEAHCLESIRVLQEVGEIWFRAKVLVTLGKIACQRRDYARALAWLQESLDLHRQVRDRQSMAETLTHLGQAAHLQADTRQAREWYQESLQLYQSLQTQRGVAPCLEGYAAVLAAQGQAARAARLLGGAAALRERLGTPRPPIEQGQYRQVLKEVCDALGKQEFSATWEQGRSLSSREAVAEALREETCAAPQADEQGIKPRRAAQ